MITITFDDALLNTYMMAFPIMEKYGFKGVIFVPTGLLTGAVKTVRLDNERYMNLNHLKELHHCGWEIGSHSVTHRNFLTLNEYEVRQELCESKRDLLNQGFEVISFAYPYGHRNYQGKHVFLASQHYKWCRNVVDGWKVNRKTPYPSERFELAGIPMDPPFEFKEEPQGWLIFVFHVIKDPNEFERWLAKLKGEVVRFLDVP